MYGLYGLYVKNSGLYTGLQSLYDFAKFFVATAQTSPRGAFVALLGLRNFCDGNVERLHILYDVNLPLD